MDPLSDEKANRLFTGRPNELQLLSNALYGRKVSRPTRALIKIALLGKPLKELQSIVDLYLEGMHKDE